MNQPSAVLSEVVKHREDKSVNNCERWTILNDFNKCRHHLRFWSDDFLGLWARRHWWEIVDTWATSLNVQFIIAQPKHRMYRNLDQLINCISKDASLLKLISVRLIKSEKWRVKCLSIWWNIYSGRQIDRLPTILKRNSSVTVIYVCTGFVIFDMFPVS